MMTTSLKIPSLSFIRLGNSHEVVKGGDEGSMYGSSMLY